MKILTARQLGLCLLYIVSDLLKALIYLLKCFMRPIIDLTSFDEVLKNLI